MFIRVIADQVTYTYEALAMTSVYFVYVGTVVGVHLYTKLIPQKSESPDKLSLFSLMTPANRRSGADMRVIHAEQLKSSHLIDDVLREGDHAAGRLGDVDARKVLYRGLEDEAGTGLLELEEEQHTKDVLGATMLNELQKELQPLDLEQVADSAWQLGAGE